MRTNIDIDDDLLKKAMRDSGAKTKKAAVEEGLRMLIQIEGQASILKLPGKVKFLTMWNARDKTVCVNMKASRNLVLIVDASVWIDLLAGSDNLHTVWLEREILRQRIGMPDLILCEVLQGIRRDRAFHEVRDRLQHHEVLNCGGEAVAAAAAENFRFLQKKGITVRKTIDCLIATFCINEGHWLLHRDRDFNPFEELLGL